MTREEAKKRLIRITGVPRPALVKTPKSFSRKEISKISVSEEDEQFTNFFDFEEDLSDLESARKQYERVEEERILQEQRAKLLGLNTKKESDEDDSSFVFSEE